MYLLQVRRPRQGARDAVRFGHDFARGAGGRGTAGEKNYGVPADVYSVTSFSELRKNALASRAPQSAASHERAAQTYMQQALADLEGPFIAATDYMKTVADQIRQWIPGRYACSAPTAIGRSDSRRAAALFRSRPALCGDCSPQGARRRRQDRQADGDAAMQGLWHRSGKPNPLSV
jgi:hypothetical protein